MPRCAVCGRLLINPEFRCCGSCYEDRNQRGIQNDCRNCKLVDCAENPAPLDKKSEDALGW